MNNYVVYDAKKLQNTNVEVFQLQKCWFWHQKIFQFSSFFLPEMVKFDLSFFKNMIFCLSSYDLNKPSRFVTESCWNFKNLHLKLDKLQNWRKSRGREISLLKILDQKLQVKIFSCTTPRTREDWVEIYSWSIPP